MKLKITKPLIIFDLETTGLNVMYARILQLSYIKVYPDGREQRDNMLFNPEETIPSFITELTGITDDDVKDKPTFKSAAKDIERIFKGCDLAGYNSNNYDIPLLCEEFLRAGIDFDFSKTRKIDALTIFNKMERHNLPSAYKFYCGRKMEDDFVAHRADQDAEATYRVLQGQLDRYSRGAEPDKERWLKNDMGFLNEFSRTNENIDFAGRFIWAEKKDDNGETILDANGKPQMVETFNFGKHKGEEVKEVLRSEPGYCGWILQSEFPLNTKQVLTRIRLKLKYKKS